jgi:hypothetical protein
MHTNTQPTTHLTGHGCLENRVRVGFQKRGEGTGRRVVSCVQVADFRQGGLEFQASVRFQFQKPHPHVLV